MAMQAPGPALPLYGRHAVWGDDQPASRWSLGAGMAGLVMLPLASRIPRAT